MEQGGEKEMNSVLSVSHFKPLCPNHSVISWSLHVALREEREWVLAFAKIVPSSIYMLSPQQTQEELICLRRGDI